jgi:hypothetical protein
MTLVTSRVATIVIAIAVGIVMGSKTDWAQQLRDPFTLEPRGETGEAIYPVFEGWGPHKDGSTVLLLGYFNRNREAHDVPIGPDNRIEPGGPDFGQPTHFDPSRQWGVFAIRVPEGFGTKRLTWTLRVNGQTTTISFGLTQAYWLDFFKYAASGNEPPVIKFSADGPTMAGPPVGIAQSLSAAVGQPLALRLWASDQPPEDSAAEEELAAMRSATARNRGTEPVAIVGGQIFGGDGPGGRRDSGRGAPVLPPDIVVNWRIHRAPGPVAFNHDRIPLHTGGDPKIFRDAVATATFRVPGEYVLRAQVNDGPIEYGGRQCCWTNANIKVTVK